MELIKCPWCETEYELPKDLKTGFYEYCQQCDRIFVVGTYGKDWVAKMPLPNQIIKFIELGVEKWDEIKNQEKALFA